MATTALKSTLNHAYEWRASAFETLTRSNWISVCVWIWLCALTNAHHFHHDSAFSSRLDMQRCGQKRRVSFFFVSAENKGPLSGFSHTNTQTHARTHTHSLSHTRIWRWGECGSVRNSVKKKKAFVSKIDQCYSAAKQACWERSQRAEWSLKRVTLAWTGRSPLAKLPHWNWQQDSAKLFFSFFHLKILDKALLGQRNDFGLKRMWELDEMTEASDGRFQPCTKAGNSSA